MYLLARITTSRPNRLGSENKYLNMATWLILTQYLIIHSVIKRNVNHRGIVMGETFSLSNASGNKSYMSLVTTIVHIIIKSVVK